LMQRGWVVSPDYRAVIDALRDARTKAEISQRELARRLGKPPSFVNKIEQLERRMDVLEFIAIAEAMNMGADELLRQMRNALPDAVRL
jgi:transcriptional regulator with XRE-family HTH domain